MIPLKLSLSNFMSYKETASLDFSQITIACVAGENGVGKSSLLEAISWTLWGKTRTFSDDNLIYQGEQNMWAELDFEIDNNQYKVARKRSLKGRGSSELNFFKITANGLKNLSENSIKETQDKIIRIIKMPYEIFVNSAYLRQGQADEFTKKKPAERKEILGEILGLDYYENLAEAAKNKVREKENELEVIRFQIEDLLTKISGKETVKKNFTKTKKVLLSHKNELAKKEKFLKVNQTIKNEYDKSRLEIINLRREYREIQDEIKNINKENKIFAQELTDLQAIYNRGEVIENGFKKFKAAIKENEQFNQRFEKLAQLKDKKNDLLRTIEEKNHRQEILKSKFEVQKQALISEIQNKIDLLKKAKKCPTCLQKIDQNVAKEIINQLSKKIIREKEKKITLPLNETKDLRRKLKSINNTILILSYDKKTHAKVKDNILDLEHFEEDREILSEAKTKIFEKEKMMAKNKNQTNKLERKLKTIGNKGANFTKKISEILPHIEKIAQVEKQVEIAREKVYVFQEEFSEAKSLYGQIIVAEKELVEKKSLLKKTSANVSVFKDLILIFGKNGLQAMIVASAVPEIQDFANRLLSKMTDGQMKVIFETKKQKKTDKEIVETLNIKVLDALGSRPYELFSGGEAFRINFAIRIALSKLLAKRSGAKLRFLTIDEGFGTQDAQGRTNLIAAIKSVKEDFAKILIITHIQELKDVFDERIDVTKDKNGSHLRFIG